MVTHCRVYQLFCQLPVTLLFVNILCQNQSISSVSDQRLLTEATSFFQMQHKLVPECLFQAVRGLFELLRHKRDI